MESNQRPRGRGLLRHLLQRLVLIPLVRFISPVHSINGDRLATIPMPVVFVSNHQSHLDTPVVLTALGPRVRKRLSVAAAADYFYRSRVIGALATFAIGTVPFDRKGSSRSSLERLKSLLRQGDSILIFPSGTRGGEDSFQPGFAYVAVDCERPVVPLYLHGLDEALPKGARIPLPSGVVVGIGEPIEPGSDYEDLVSRTQAAHDRVRREVIAAVKGWGA